MRSKFLGMIFIASSVFLLSACSGFDELIDGASKFFQSSSENNEENNGEQAENNNGQNNNENTNNENLNEDSGVENEDTNNEDNDAEETVANVDPNLPFDEKLVAQGYEIRTLPNGFPFSVPYHWIFVKPQQPIADDTGYLGMFCFDIPLTFPNIASFFTTFDDARYDTVSGQGDTVYQITFTLNELFQKQNVPVTIDFFHDAYENTCAHVRADSDITGFMDMEDEPVQPSVNRQIPENYNEVVNRLNAKGDIEGYILNESDRMSIRENLLSSHFDMQHLLNGEPTIFPYEWYLVDKLELSTGWTGTLCTDMDVHQSMLKHLDMLEKNNANIEFVTLETTPRPNVYAQVSFDFNDMHGTGSWSGLSMFFVNPEGTFANMTCAQVEMHFSTDLID